MKSRSFRILLVAAILILAALVVIYKTHRSNSFSRSEPARARPAAPPRSQPRLVSHPAAPAPVVADAPASAEPAVAAPPVSAAAAPPQTELAARDSARARRVKEARYMLPTDRYLRSAGLELTDDQQRRLQAAKDALKPRIDASLTNIWIQIDDLNKQKDALLNGVTPDQRRDQVYQAQLKQIYDQLRVANEEEAIIAHQLDQDYQVQVLALLTPEQQTRYTQAVGAMMHNFTPAATK